ncbi:hypothetical protein SteCoe_1225 [Stentor coeruleus]|uniref:Uncharacterized protein n=1 Tax=Stentor coeruleus TaxID=5963 RepID=A0A1R2D2F8_9CILI|nr:hypothetical protein SteCoe_1225 [Stentor coeruleus]
MSTSFKRRNNLKTTTLPPWSNDNILEDLLITKDPRETIEAIRQLLETGQKGPNLHLILATMPNRSVKLLIPETLIKFPHLPTLYLYTDEKGFVHSKADENCLSMFFKNVASEKNNEGIPKYVHIDENIHLCMDSKEALHWWVVSKAEMHMLQKYVVPCKKNLQKLRVYWKAKTGLRFLVVSSITTIQKIIPKPKKNSIISIGIYQHKIKDYAFAGRLLRASFDPTLPNRSLISIKKENPITEENIKEINQDLDKHFLVKFSDKYGTKLCEVPTFDEVKDIVMRVIQCINNNVNGNTMSSLSKNIEGDNQVISEIIIDFMLDKNSNWVFIQCKAFKMDYMPTKYNTLFPMKTLSENSLNHYEEFLSRPTNEPFLSIASLTSRLNCLGKKSAEMLKKQKYSSPEIIPKIYVSHFPELSFSLPSKQESLTKDVYTDIYSLQINRVADHYDRIRSLAKKNKIDTIRRKTAILTESIVTIAVNKILRRLEVVNDLKKVAEIGEGFFPQFFAKVLEEEKNMEFFFKFQQSFDWKLTMRQYRMMHNIIVDECKKVGLFNGSEFQALTRALEKLEAFIFKYHYTND